MRTALRATGGNLDALVLQIKGRLALFQRLICAAVAAAMMLTLGLRTTFSLRLTVVPFTWCGVRAGHVLILRAPDAGPFLRRQEVQVNKSAGVASAPTTMLVFREDRATQQR